MEFIEPESSIAAKRYGEAEREKWLKAGTDPEMLTTQEMARAVLGLTVEHIEDDSIEPTGLIS